jgi:hypothetical protein
MGDGGQRVPGARRRDARRLDHHIQPVRRDQRQGIVGQMGGATLTRRREGGGGELLGRPASGAARLARPLHIQVGNPQDLHPGGASHLGQEHGAELAGPDEADPDGAARDHALLQETEEVHDDDSLS